MLNNTGFDVLLYFNLVTFFMLGYTYNISYV